MGTLPIGAGVINEPHKSAVTTKRGPLRRTARRTGSQLTAKPKLRPIVWFSLLSASLLLLVAILSLTLFDKAKQISGDLRSAEALVAELRSEVGAQKTAEASETVERISSYARSARTAAESPSWKLAGALPFLGANFSAVRETAVAMDELVDGTARPLVTVAGSVSWRELQPVDGKFNIEPLEAAAPSVVKAANALNQTHARLRDISRENLLDVVREPLDKTTNQLDDLRRVLDIAANVSSVLPPMVGQDGSRNYLVLVQNNAEIRATGGLTGALAVLTIDHGAITLREQSSASPIDKFNPPVDVDASQRRIFSDRLGKFIGDINLTPNFPTAARTAKEMWEIRRPDSIDGVIAIDPIVLANVLEASGPIPVPAGDAALANGGLPTTLTSKNVVKLLLSDVYRIFPTNQAQDAYFASASHEIFKALSNGQAQGEPLMRALSRSAAERRILVWSSHEGEQKILENLSIGGAAMASSGGAAFGVYFNDGTGAKMDFYVRRTVQLQARCEADGYVEYKVAVTLTNTAPTDADRSLPTSVTGGGRFGTPPGSVQTNIVVYGPALSQVDSVSQDGARVSFGSHLADERPVGTLTTRLAPGQTAKVQIVFQNVVQHSRPELVVTPTIQDLNDVVQPPSFESCGESFDEPS